MLTTHLAKAVTAQKDHVLELVQADWTRGLKFQFTVKTPFSLKFVKADKS